MQTFKKYAKFRKVDLLLTFMKTFIPSLFSLFFKILETWFFFRPSFNF